MSFRLPVLLSILALVVANPALAQDQLRWKFRSGDSLRYTIVQDMDSSAEFGNEVVKSTFSQTIDMSWQVRALSADGATSLHQTFDRVRLKMVGGPAGTIEFDSASKEASDNPIIKALSDVFGNIVGQQFQVTIQPTGQIDNVIVPEKLKQAVRESAAGQSGALNEKMLNDMMKQSAVMLPFERVSRGSKWVTEQNVQMPFGTMTITSAMTWVQTDAAGNAVIDFVPSVKITPREGAAKTITLKSATGRGRVIFDIARGRVNKSHLDLTMQMTMDVNGQKIPQTIHNVTSMALVP